MQWITSTDLKQWADQIGARIAFPVLVRDLIVASAADVTDLRFPGGESGQIRGFDGVLEAAGAPPYVPAGRSIWEFGVNADPRSKFIDDYDKRVRELEPAERKDMTFVFATPRRWDKATEKLPDFLKTYRESKDFADVQYVDGAQLEQWLEQHAAVGAKHARQVLGRIPQTGARSTEEFWAEYSRRFKPPLTEQVVLSGRAAQADAIVTHLLGKAGSMVYVGDGPEEVNAVAVAAIRLADAKQREFLEARTLVVDTIEAGRVLAINERYGYIVSPPAQPVAGMLAGYGPVVGSMGFKAGGSRFSRLERPSTRDMAEALKTMGYSDEEASAVATRSGRSLTILERQIPSTTFEPPAWTGQARDVLPALLAGGWDAGRDGDRAVLADLAGTDYVTYEARIRSLLSIADAPFDREGGIWKLRAPVDAFVNMGSLLGPEHLDLLKRAAVKVFGDLRPPQIGEERLNVSDATHSTWLRNGLSGTLLMLATLHDEADLDLGTDLPSFVDDVVAALPGLSDDIGVILALERQLPYLMEAAPDPLLSALERQLGGDDENIRAVLEERPAFGAPRNATSNLLWALEMLAWDPRRLLRASLALARLAALNTDGRSGNRAINSLRDIFVAWDPGTNAPLDQRLATLDAIVEVQPAVGWNLLVQLLPKIHDAKGPTQRPRFRDAGASARETLTHALVAETYDAVADRVLELVLEDGKRWVQIVEAFPFLSPTCRVQFLDLLSGSLESIKSETRNELRRKLTMLADRHSRFPEAEWSLPAFDVEGLRRVAAALEAKDPLHRARALFDEWLPRMAADPATARADLESSRRAAVARLVEVGGANAVLDLSRSVRLPGLVAAAAAAVVPDGMLGDLIADADDDGRPTSFAITLAGEIRAARGEGIDDELLAIATAREWTGERVGILLSEWPEAPTTWDLVEDQGEDAVKAFWSRRRPRGFDGATDDLVRLVGLYLTAGRPSAALDATYGRQDDLAWPLLRSILVAEAEVATETSMRSEMDAYLLEELFKSLRARPNVPKIELARLEYDFFPLLEHHHRDLALFELMASDPVFFVDMLTHVYVADGADADATEPTAEESARATASHRILMAFEAVPGERDGVVDGALLDGWIEGVIREAAVVRRTNVVLSYVGRVLAHSAELDGVWPQPAVTAAVERLASDEVEQGIMIERFNMRGVYTKAIFEGGVQERDLAKQAREWAGAQPGRNLRTRAMLETIADRWEGDAKRADETAAVDKLRFD